MPTSMLIPVVDYCHQVILLVDYFQTLIKNICNFKKKRQMYKKWYDQITQNVNSSLFFETGRSDDITFALEVPWDIKK